MTRLFYEKLLTDEFPDLQWVRVCTSAPYMITVYACDSNLDLDEDAVARLQWFLSKAGMASCVHKVKHYFELQNDEAFPIGQVPCCLKEAALKSDVTRLGVQAALRVAFPIVDPERFEVDKNVVIFHLLKDDHWTPYQRKFAELMLTEILPVGSTAKLATETTIS